MRDTQCVRRMPSLSTGADDFALFEPGQSSTLHDTRAAESLDVPIHVTGASARAHVVVDQEEARRRAQFRLKAILDPMLLDACLTIREEPVVGWHYLSAQHREVLLRAPAGVFTELDGRLQVDLAVPVHVNRIVVSDGSWRRSLARADALRRFAPTTIRVTQELPDDRIWEASYLGVGVTLAAPNGEKEVIPPDSGSWRLDTSRWRFAERCWRRVLEP